MFSPGHHVVSSIRQHVLRRDTVLKATSQDVRVTKAQASNLKRVSASGEHPACMRWTCLRNAFLSQVLDARAKEKMAY